VIGPEAVHRVGAQLAAVDQLAQQRLAVLEQLARGGALRRVVEDRRVAPLQLPRGEEERPVDVLRDLGQRRVGDHAPAGERRRRELAGAEGQHRAPRARVGERQGRPLVARSMGEPQALLRSAVLAVELRKLLRVEHARHHRHHA
jgi:hypothetical protein